jgi:hypothetical protein
MRRTAHLFGAVVAAAVSAVGGTAFAQSHYLPPIPQVVMAHGGPGGSATQHPGTIPSNPCPPIPCPPSYTDPLCAIPPATTQPGATASPLETLTSSPFTTPDTTPAFGSDFGGAGIGSSTAVNPGGYIDGAIPLTTVRLRYDIAYNNNRPDRASFFYPKCGCFGTRDAKGPPLSEQAVDFQEFSTYLEYLVAPRFSVFGELPIRHINPVVNANTTGLGDVSFGTRYAAILTNTGVVTLQVRATAPSGDGDKGLGTENWWVTPGVLWQQQATDRLILFGEIQDFIPVAPTSDFAGNVLRYGFGYAYMLVSTPRVRILPVSEIVGWTVLSGRESHPELGSVSAAGATIVNWKSGVRIGFGEVTDPGVLGRSDLYLGYGRPLTGEVWYKNLYRLEYRLRF